MDTHTIKGVASAASVVLGLIAALLWLFASYQTVRPSTKPDENGMYPMQIIEIHDSGKRVDVLATAKRQTFWNAWAALSASLAAFCQVLFTLC
jgi:hypothetical protein